MSENGYAKPDDLFAQSKERRYADVEIHGRKFCLTSWTAREAEQFNKDNERESLSVKANERMIAKTCVDATTKELLFTPTDIEKLRDLDAGFVSLLTNQCVMHLGLNEDTEKN